MTYTVTANGKVMYRTSGLLGGTDAEAQQRANEVASIITRRQPDATVRVMVG